MGKAAYVTIKGRHAFVEAPFNEDFVNELKVLTTTREKDMACSLVKKHFPDINAYLIEGGAAKNLHTSDKAMAGLCFNPQKRAQIAYNVRREYWEAKIKAFMVAVYPSEERKFDKPLIDYSPEQLETLYRLLAQGLEPKRSLEILDYPIETDDIPWD